MPDEAPAKGAPGLLVERSQASPGVLSPLVVCVHGSMDRHTSFSRLRARLADDFDVVTYDRRGYSGSRDVLPPAEGIDAHVEDLAAVIESSPARVADVVVGHSYGGDVALALAERRPDLVRSLVVFEPPLSWTDMWRDPAVPVGTLPFAAATPEASAERFLRRMIGDRRYERVPFSTRTELLRDGPALVAEMIAIRVDDPPFDPARIGQPVIVGCGSLSNERHLAANAWLAESLPHAKPRVIDGARHGAHRSHSREIAGFVHEALELAGGVVGPHIGVPIARGAPSPGAD